MSLPTKPINVPDIPNIINIALNTGSRLKWAATGVLLGLILAGVIYFKIRPDTPAIDTKSQEKAIVVDSKQITEATKVRTKTIAHGEKSKAAVDKAIKTVDNNVYTALVPDFTGDTTTKVSVVPADSVVALKVSAVALKNDFDSLKAEDNGIIMKYVDILWKQDTIIAARDQTIKDVKHEAVTTAVKTGIVGSVIGAATALFFHR